MLLIGPTHGLDMLRATRYSTLALVNATKHGRDSETSTPAEWL